MKFTLKLLEIKSLDEIPGYWTDEDFLNILEELEVSDARGSSSAELRELIEMALGDFEPHESAEHLLRYKLHEELNRGQIQNLSHEMSEDDESAGNADISLHYTLFNINQLLGAVFRGIYPKNKATRLTFELKFNGTLKGGLTKEAALKALCCGLVDQSPILRLFEDQLNGKEPFADAEHLVWELHAMEPHIYQMITSEFWISKEDFREREFSGSLKFYEDRNGS